MGSGSWNTRSYATYCCSVGHGYDTSTCTLKSDYTNSSQAFKSYKLDKAMDPKNVIRECCDSDEHPSTIPVIFFVSLRPNNNAYV